MGGNQHRRLCAAGSRIDPARRGCSGPGPAAAHSTPAGRRPAPLLEHQPRVPGSRRRHSGCGRECSRPRPSTGRPPPWRCPPAFHIRQRHKVIVGGPRGGVVVLRDHFGFDHARNDVVHIDPVLRQLNGHDLRQQLKPRLRRAIGGAPGATALARQRRDVDDLSAAALYHFLRHALRDHEGAGQVDADDVLEFFERGSRNGVLPPTPALLTSRSIRPCASMMARIIDATEAWSPTFTPIPSQRPPRPLMLSAAALAPSALMSATTTTAPSRANALARRSLCRGQHPLRAQPYPASAFRFLLAPWRCLRAGTLELRTAPAACFSSHAGEQVWLVGRAAQPQPMTAVSVWGLTFYHYTSGRNGDRTPIP